MPLFSARPEAVPPPPEEPVAVAPQQVQTAAVGVGGWRP